MSLWMVANNLFTNTMQFRFNSAKAAQAGAFLLKRNSGSMDKYLFIKMLYIADRESLSKWSEPITGDVPVSMELGPVLSIIYNLTKGEAIEHRSFWSPFISDADKQTNQISLKDDPGRDQLSNNELRLIESVYERFKNFTWGQMRDFCHAFPEYEDVGKSSKVIPIKNILVAVGKKPEQVAAITQNIQEMIITDLLMEG